MSYYRRFSPFFSIFSTVQTVPGVQGVGLLNNVIEGFQSIVCACNAWFTAVNFPIGKVTQNLLHQEVPGKLWIIYPPLASNLSTPGLKLNLRIT